MTDTWNTTKKEPQKITIYCGIIFDSTPFSVYTLIYWISIYIYIYLYATRRRDSALLNRIKNEITLLTVRCPILPPASIRYSATKRCGHRWDTRVLAASCRCVAGLCEGHKRSQWKGTGIPSSGGHEAFAGLGRAGQSAFAAAVGAGLCHNAEVPGENWWVTKLEAAKRF